MHTLDRLLEKDRLLASSRVACLPVMSQSTKSVLGGGKLEMVSPERALADAKSLGLRLGNEIRESWKAN